MKQAVFVADEEPFDEPIQRHTLSDEQLRHAHGGGHVEDDRFGVRMPGRDAPGERHRYALLLGQGSLGLQRPCVGDTTPAYMSYAASKGGVVALTRSLARGFGKDGICAFVLTPGFVRTDMAQDFIDEYGEAFVVGDLALDHLTEPAHLAPLVVLLASGLADHATGTTIDVNAGSYVH